MKSSLKKVIAMTLITIAAVVTNAGHLNTEKISGSFYLSVGETQQVRLGHDVYVENIIVQASGASRSDGMFEVWANGKSKGTIFVPGRDPSYVVTIREVVSSLEFRHVSGGSALISCVKAAVGPGGFFGGGWRPQLGMSGSTVSELASQTLELVNIAKPMATYKQLGAYLLPIRKAAAHLYAIAQTHFESECKIREGMAALLIEINAASAYIEENLETESAFELSVNLLAVREQLSNFLR